VAAPSPSWKKGAGTTVRCFHPTSALGLAWEALLASIGLGEWGWGTQCPVLEDCSRAGEPG
jgi:hypothetical protein